MGRERHVKLYRAFLQRPRSGRIVLSVNLPMGLYQELLKLMETGEYVHLSDLIRAALRFYIDYRRRVALARLELERLPAKMVG